ncbi:NCS2 family permease [Mycoplasma sp. Mirounga ES2805-ORL]|uniref:NCS2 family permease n=1 Tax=Mycoplasma sp. Mirounga ES2805-ORL TaxID=754514 RepID=UPI00197B12C9|nr:NCS2 family permease [Mycoplasma sp. Mirounga ES2805-ORL]QSF13730.1 NCS2 family permease [Mycoplasma sp. Mirounga ES2805-ORL]
MEQETSIDLNQNKQNGDNLNDNKNKKQSSFVKKIDKFFKISERKSNIKTELISGLITFLAMSYILIANPNILSDPHGANMKYGAAFLATALSAFLGTMLMGLFGKLPLGLAPGMGVNAFFSYTVAAKWGYSAEQALGICILSGLLFLIISLTPIRKTIIKAIPKDLKLAIGAGIGLFIAFIGLQNSGIIVPNGPTDTFTANNITVDPGKTIHLAGPGTLVFQGTPSVTLGNLASPLALLALGGILLSIILYARKIKFNFIISILVTATVGAIINYSYYGINGSFIDNFPKFDFNGQFKYSELGSFKDIVGKGFVSIFTDGKSFWKISILPAIITFLFLDLFDTLGTFVGVANPLGLINKDGELEGADRALMSDSIATIGGAVLGTPVVTTFIESSAGIEYGGKTGLSSIMISFLFALSIPLFPLFAIFATSPAVTAMVLFTLGIMMMSQLKYINWDDISIAASTFTIIIFMLLTFSISNGIAFGFIVYVTMKFVQGKFKDIHPMLYGLFFVFIGYLTIIQFYS